MDTRPHPVTLVLVSYHKADVIGRVIESVAGGSVVPDLLVVSDDGSTDGTPDAAEAAARRCGLPYRILRHPRAGRYRLQTMRNSGIANALDGLILVSDSDCVFDRYTVESHQAIHLRHPLAIGSGPRFEYLQGQSGPFTSMYTTLEFAHFPATNYLVPFGANLSFRKSLWRRLGGFDRAYEGSYGLDDHEFCLRAELMGAACVSDPGAYVFHCPHDTIFGGRPVDRNWVLFRDTMHRDFGVEQWHYVRRCVLPWYWRGNRRRPLLGDKLQLDSWGAPAGFLPPLHLALMGSLAPLVQPAERLYASGAYEDAHHLTRLVQKLDERMLPLSSGPLVFVQDLRWMLKEFRLDQAGGKAKLMPHLAAWLDRARSYDKDCAGLQPAALRWHPADTTQDSVHDSGSALRAAR